MRRTATPKLDAYAALTGIGLVTALVLGRLELVALAAPFAVVLLFGLSLERTPRVDAFFDLLVAERALQGDTVEAELELRSDRDVGHLQLLLDLPNGLVAESPNPQLLRLEANVRRTLELAIHCRDWGAYLPGDFVLREQDSFGLLVHETSIERRQPLKVYPRAEALRRLLRPVETRA